MHVFATPALFVDQLTVMDFAYFDVERGIVGESWIVDVTLSGDLDEQGMLFDFGDVKKQLKATIDELVDHKFVVPTGFAGFSSEVVEGNLVLKLTDSSSRTYQHISPEQSVVLLGSERVSRAAVTELIVAACSEVVPDNVTGVDIAIRTEVIDGAYYHYAHGLKKHLGDCQRIAHGHRSQIQIFAQGSRSEALEQQWATRWRDIYLGTAEDLLESFNQDGVDYYRFGYHSQQGRFELTIPASRCEIIDTDSTVELIAVHIKQQLSEQHPGQEILVKAFEGVNKGALA